MSVSISAPSVVGRRIDGRYVVREHLADGGMGSVYVALDERLDREVALKIMRPDLARDTDFVARFRREARSAARLTHPNVVAVTDQGADDTYVFLAMELVRGRTLRDLIRQDAPLPPRQALDIADGILQALQAAHRAGLVHRDIKPENVLIGDSGVKVADFGLARAVTTDTLTGDSDVLLGTAAYLSPEQVESGRADERSDVYSTGLLLFEMLTGEKAFPGESPIHVAYQHVHGRMPTASDAVSTVPAQVDDLITAATAREPDERPADAGAFLDRLRAVRAQLAPESLDAAPQPTAQHPDDRSHTDPLGAGSTRHIPRSGSSAPARSGRRRRRPVILALLLAVVLLLGGGGAWAFTAGPLGSVTVPTVAGKKQGSAVQAVQHAGLHAQVRQAFSETVAAGTVISSSPSAGDSSRKTDAVTLTVSKGPERHTVPSLAGRTEAAAKSAITDAHLKVGSVSQAYDATVPSGKVVRTSPAAGSSLKPNTSVDVVVSKGKQPVTVPDVTGSSKADAEKQLTDAGLKVSYGTEQHSDDVAKGDIISQTPADGTLFAGDTVTLVVSKGPVMVTVPKVVGMSTNKAKQTLEKLGFTVKTHYPLVIPVLNTVQGQSVNAGKQAAKGSTITIDVV